MNNIIEKLSENPFNNVEKTDLKCPVCSADLYTAHNYMFIVMDGNTVYHCENKEDHKFWRNARECQDILHLNKNASETDFNSEGDYEFNGETWFVC